MTRRASPGPLPPLRLAIALPHMRTGGVERNVVRLLPHLLEHDIVPTLYLQDNSGPLLESVPASVQVVDLGGRGTLNAARHLSRALRRAPTDILWTQTNALNIAALLGARLLRASAPRHVPQVVLAEHIPIRAFLASRRNPRLRLLAMRALYSRATGLIAPLPALIEEHAHLLGKAMPPGSVLPNPVIDALALPRTQPVQAQRMVAIGRLSPEKDFDLCLRTFALAARELPEARLTLYGVGSEHEALSAQIQALGLGDKARLAGETRDVSETLAKADMFLCTSRLEGFGNAIVEAHAASVPVFSVDCPFGPRVLLRGGGAGCLVDSRDPAVLARALVAYARNQTQRAAHASAGCAVAADYTVAASARAHARYFRGLCAMDASQTATASSSGS